MSTYLSVQKAARHLGVSPVTIRRWTSTGFLPCTRTAGGHRRIAVDDIDELTRAIGGSTHLAARLARERELETLVETSVAVSSQLDLSKLLAEIAKHMTRLVDCQFCSVSEYDRESQRVRTLAEYDATGKRLPDPGGFHLREFPLTRAVLREQTPAVVNVDDPHSDAAEVAALRREGDKSLLILPLVYQGESVGIVEVIDNTRMRKYTRQELRLCEAVAGQAAVALHNANVFGELRRSDEDVTRLRDSLAALTASLRDLASEPEAQGFLERVARVTCDALQAASCVVSAYGMSAGAAAETSAAAPSGDAGGDSARLLVARDTTGTTDLSITAALRRPAGEGQAELLDLIAAATGAAVTRLRR